MRRWKPDMPSHTFDGRVYYSINEAANAAGVSRRTIYNWMAHNLLQVVETPSGTKRIVAEDLLRARPRVTASFILNRA